jgi:hypothetical protein
MIEVTVLTDRALAHLGNFKRLRTLKLINTNVSGRGVDGLKDLPALEELDLNLIMFSPEVARLLGRMQSHALAWLVVVVLLVIVVLVSQVLCSLKWRV